MTDPADREAIVIGDIVRVGKGKVPWRVHSFWSRAGVQYADLRGGGGYSTTSATVDRLTIVTKVGAS